MENQAQYENLEENTESYLAKALQNTDVKFTKEIKQYVNNSGCKCLNEFEITNKISRGLIWKVKKVKRYFKNEEGELKTETYALKVN
jgi:hypothetical protein